MFWLQITMLFEDSSDYDDDINLFQHDGKISLFKEISSDDDDDDDDGEESHIVTGNVYVLMYTIIYRYMNGLCDLIIQSHPIYHVNMFLFCYTYMIHHIWFIEYVCI